MVSPLAPDMAEKIVELATDQVLEIMGGVGDLVEGSDGAVFGDQVLKTPGARIDFYLDLRNRGVLENLKSLAGGKWYRQLQKQFERDATTMMTGGQQ